MGILDSHHWLYHSNLESVLLNFPLSFLILEVEVVGKELLSLSHQCSWIAFFGEKIRSEVLILPRSLSSSLFPGPHFPHHHQF